MEVRDLRKPVIAVQDDALSATHHTYLTQPEEYTKPGWSGEEKHHCVHCRWIVPHSIAVVITIELNTMDDEATYICDACGEEIVIPIDPTAGPSQEYVEDCPVCCRASVIGVEINEDGEVRVWAEAE